MVARILEDDRQEAMKINPYLSAVRLQKLRIRYTKKKRIALDRRADPGGCIAWQLRRGIDRLAVSDGEAIALLALQSSSPPEENGRSRFRSHPRSPPE